MQSIVTALDRTWVKRAKDICGELRAIGLKQMRPADRPRFAYQAAERYEPAKVELALFGVAAGARAFAAEPAALALFRGNETVIYASITPSDQLRAMHRLVWDAMVPVASGRAQAYAPETWVPHVALAAGPVPDDKIDDVTALLARHDAAAWPIKVNNICYVPDADDAAVDWLRLDFK